MQAATQQLRYEQLTGRQKVAILLTALDVDTAGQILRELEPKEVEQIALEIASLRNVSPELIQAVLEDFYQLMTAHGYVAEGGLEYATQLLERSLGPDRARDIMRLVVEILNKSTSAMAKSLLEAIEARDPALAEEIKRQMFLFEDIVLIDDRGVQRILREVDKHDLALALKVADEKVRQKIFKNMSERAAAVIREELEFMGPVRLKEVEAAQSRIVEVIRRLAEQEEIVISGRGKEEVYV
jgi:flagellar motor switch protein FliG